MEGLEKLEQVQRTIHLLHSVGISDANPDSERFLADFTFLLMQHCGELDITSKCELISKHMSKISSLFIDGALPFEAKGCSMVGNAAQLYPEPDLDPLDDAMVGMDSMMRSNSTLEDFCRSYFMFHNMEASQPRSIFSYLPILSFTESYIYQLDGFNEKLLQLPSSVPVFSKDFEDVDSKLGAKSVRMFRKDPFRPLLIVLERQGLLTERIEEELRCGEEYWALERELCSALVSNKEISIKDATRAIHLKSFDYRIMNLLLYQLRGEKVNELHMEFLSVSELLVEVSDDLFDYEDDVVENNFNILRMFVKYYGPSAAPIMLAKFITEAEEKYDGLLKALDPELSMKYQKRCEEATSEGGKTYGPSLGTWHIPPVIEDEARYRAAFSQA
ncbi:uncharacterized protein LOC105178295 isoform X1 [Sesamum indicum]|uniref:Uncharacterized protein LOC105178295 isoform X1 n=2 Tax=Sesamum indicum TaxID=4182 RepID=A0A6I9UXZ5_SESIN|nr:uncharacterized protein LOC105178295 isoform X1 [Sesamum indicum]